MKYAAEMGSVSGFWYALSIYVQLLLLFPHLFIINVLTHFRLRPSWPSSGADVLK
jgi:hypothetical protein